MLATQSFPAPTFGLQPAADDYRPAKDIEAFNSLLPPPIEFIEGSSSGAYAVPEGKYQPINVPTTPKHEISSESSKTPYSASKSVSKQDTAPVKNPKSPGKSLWPAGIDSSWPPNWNVGSGLYNTGNTCFLNSALQCLLHTPPLLRLVNQHKTESCSSKGFCMICAMKQVAVKAHSSRNSFSPAPISSRLQTIAKSMRKGRQEDTHEFLRYAIDALQKACLSGLPPKIDHKLAETTWVHKVFGGRLRSRVHCKECGYNSDTYDRILDLSLDIFKADSVKDALRKFVAIDYLKGADKYKCEKCKRAVNAEKRFTVDEAPLVLSVHLKRFSPLGRKIGHHVNYDEQLSLKPYMSEESYGPVYSLYGIICHAGGGPNSGHYYAYVKAKDGKWWQMDDESVSPEHGAPLNKKSAYMLFYIRQRGEGLENAIKGQVHGVLKEQRMKARLSQSMKGKDGADDKGEKFIGPLLPSPSINGDMRKSTSTDPQADALKAKIAKARQARSSINTLSQYKSDDEDDEDVGEKVEAPKDETNSLSKDVEMHPSSPSPPPQTSSPAQEEVGTSGIAPSSFYGSTSTPLKKRKSPDTAHREGSFHKRPNLSSHSGFRSKHKLQPPNPFNKITYSKKNRKPPRGL